MTTTWIVAADPTLGRVIEIEDDAPAEVRRFARPEPTNPAHEAHPPAANVFETFDGERRAHKVEPESDETQRMAFTREIGNYVEHARRDRRFEKLVLVADARVLANLRKQLSGETMKLVANEVSKNLARHNIEQIRGYLAPYLSLQ
mgnify:CR=1 FL=1